MRQLKISKILTNREDVSLDKYLQEIGRVELISAEEEVILARKIRTGDLSALHKLTNSNLRFVVSVSKQYQNQGLGLPDLINEGNLGLIKAAYRFDETRGFKFISYAVWWIRQSIIQAIADQSRIVRLPLNRVGAVSKVYKTSAKLEQVLKREPTAEEIASVLELTSDEITNTFKEGLRSISMDAPVSKSDENSGNLHDFIPANDELSPEQGLMHESLKKQISIALESLSDRESEIISCYFGLKTKVPLSVGEIAERFGLSTERVRQIKEKSLKKLKSTSSSKVLATYLG
jgi:RNA polymerase primary sigma factor